MVITHGAGSNCESPLLRAVAETFAAAGFFVRAATCPTGSSARPDRPFQVPAARDREGCSAPPRRCARSPPEYVSWADTSYGGRQATLLAAETPGVADNAASASYPLHPPRKPEQLRTQHFPQLRTPALYIHGTRDPFGSIDEIDYRPSPPFLHATNW